MSRIIKYPIFLFLLFIAFYMVTPLNDAYHNEFKPIKKGYKSIEYDFLDHYGEKISDDLFMYIHYFITFAENAREFNSVEKANLNKAYLDCIEDNKIFNITCMKNLQSTGKEFLINDKCSWTFFGHTPIVQHKNYYLVNIKEKMCGTFVARFNSYYVFEYTGNYLKVTNAFLPGKSLFNPIKYYKINEDSFSFVTEGCAHGADSCRGQRADWLELEFINEKYI